MGFTLIGKIVAVNKEETVTSKSDASKSFKRRQVLLDCSRYDSITCEKLQENYPLLEFGGKGLEQLNTLCSQGLKKDDIVSIEFAVQGYNYKDNEGKTKNYTGIRPYSIAMYTPKNAPQTQDNAQQSSTQGTAPSAPTPAPASTQQEKPTADDLPF